MFRLMSGGRTRPAQTQLARFRCVAYANANAAHNAPPLSHESIMFARLYRRFRRRPARYVWSPAVDFTDRRITAALFLFDRA